MVELLPLLWIPLESVGWIGLASGVLGSIALLLPPLRLEFLKASRSTLGAMNPRSRILKQYKDSFHEYFTDKIEEVDELDAFWLFIGGILLMFYFLYQIPGKLELANMKSDFQGELNQFKAREIEPLRDRLQELEDR